MIGGRQEEFSLGVGHLHGGAPSPHPSCATLVGSDLLSPLMCAQGRTALDPVDVAGAIAHERRGGSTRGQGRSPVPHLRSASRIA